MKQLLSIGFNYDENYHLVFAVIPMDFFIKKTVIIVLSIFILENTEF